VPSSSPGLAAIVVCAAQSDLVQRTPSPLLHRVEWVAAVHRSIILRGGIGSLGAQRGMHSIFTIVAKRLADATARG